MPKCYHSPEWEEVVSTVSDRPEMLLEECGI